MGDWCSLLLGSLTVYRAASGVLGQLGNGGCLELDGGQRELGIGGGIICTHQMKRSRCKVEFPSVSILVGMPEVLHDAMQPPQRRKKFLL